MILVQPKFRSKIAKAILLIVLTCFWQLPFAFSQKGVTNNGARMVVNSGSYINIRGSATDANFTNKSYLTYNGRIDLDGKIKLQGGWYNNASSGNVLINMDADGEVVFNGTSIQGIFGLQTNFEKLTLDNSFGLSLSATPYINGILTFTNGSIVLNSSNLTIGATGSISGTMGSTKMIITNGTGLLQKEFGSTGSFSFPVGENTGTSEYTRAIVSLNSGTITPPAYIAVKVIDNKQPYNGSLSEYLSRYWTVSYSGIASPNLAVYYFYTDADIVGVENSIYGAKYLGAARTLFSPIYNTTSNYNYISGLTSLGDFTGVDGTVPTVSLSTTAPNPTNSAIPVAVTFSERVTKFASSDISKTNCTLSTVSTTDSIVFTFNATPITDGVVTININAAVCTDLAGNDNTASNTISLTFDDNAPGVTLTSSVPSRTNAAFNVTFTFTENVTGFVSGDISYSNATISGFSGSGTTYSATFTPIGQGTVTVSVAANKAQDAALNWNTASTNTITTIFDNIKPTPTLSSTATSPTKLKPFVLKIVMSEKITGSSFTLDDITVGNGTKDNLQVIQTDSIWNVNITPTSDGTVTVDIGSGLVTDYAGNTNDPATQFSISYDGTKPNVTIGSVAPNPTKTSPIPVTITFSEEVNGFAKSDLSFTNVNAGSTTMTTSDSTIFTLGIVPSAHGTVIINVPADVATDNAGNGNNAAVQFSIMYDINAPTVSIYTPSNGATGVPISSNLELVFSESVVVGTGNITIKKTVGDVLVQTIDVTSGAVTGSGTNTIIINPSDFESLIGYYVEIANTAFKDNAGNNYAGISGNSTWSFTSIDANSPFILSTTPADNAIDVDLNANLEIIFSETIVKGSGNIFIHKTSDNSIVETIDVTNGIVTVSTNTVTINPVSDLAGETGYYVLIDAGAFTDGTLPFAGISSTGGWNFTTRDVAAPLAISYMPDNDSTGVSVNSDLVITFNEIVNTNTGNVTITNQSTTLVHEQFDITSPKVTGSGTNTITINPGTDFSSKNKYYVEIASGALRDASNNNFAGISGPGTWAFTTADIVAPAVTLSTTAPSNVNAAFTVQITFSEKIQNFDVNDISADNSTISLFTEVEADSIFTVLISPVSNGTVTVKVISSVCQDLAGNFHTASNTITRTFDNIKPSVIITANKTSPLNSAFTITVEFSEDVTGFIESEIMPSNATISDFSGSNSTYTAIITPITDGNVTVNIAADVAEDIAGNTNSQATEFEVTYDGTSPTLAISAVSPNPTNNTTLNTLFTFSEQVSGFDIDSISVTNGTKVSCLTTDSIVFEVEITANVNTNVTITSTAGAAKDLAGNDNIAPTALVIVHDDISPTVTITSTFSPGPVTVSPFEIQIQFSEKIVGFDFADLIVINGVPSNLVTIDSINYTVDINPSNVGLVTVDINASAVVDLAGNNSSAATQFSITYEGTSTDVTISYTGADPTNTTPLPITIAFTEPVNGFNTTDFVLTNCTVNNLQTSNNQDFTAMLNPVSSGIVKAKIPANAATNSLGNGNNPSNEIQIAFDNTAPTVLVGSTETSPTNSTSIPVTITFNESVTGFDITDVTVSSGTLSGWSVLDNVYSTTLIPPANSATITISVAAGAALDIVNNPNSASNLFTIIYDKDAPAAISITTLEDDPTFENQFGISMLFSEKVIGFTVDEIAVTNGTASNLNTIDSVTFTADITATAVGTVSISIPADIAADMAGNLNTALITPFTIVYAGPKPGVTISSATQSPTNAASITIDIVFTESVTGFTIDDINVIGGTVSNLAGSDAIWTATLTPLADGIVSVSIPENSVTNSYLNGNTASNTYQITFDNTPPSITITSNPLNYTNLNPIPVTLVFNEKVSGFAIGDIVIGNGSSTTLTTTDSIYFNLDVTPTAEGEVTINIGADMAFDQAGNGNVAATQFSIIYDNTAPTVSITSTETSPTSSFAIPVTVTFSELVSGFDISDIIINNGSAQNLVPNSNIYTFTLVPNSDGIITVDIAGNSCTDLAGNYNTGAVQFSITVESGAPSVSISSTVTNPTNSTNIPIDITFTEPVTGFESADIVLSNASISGVMTNVGNVYSIIINPISDGQITIDVPAAVANDLYGNPNIAADQLMLTYDGTVPTVTIETTITSPTNISPIPLTITFSESVFNFVESDITVTNGTIIDFAGSGNLYTANLIPNEGAVSVNIAAEVASDQAGNGNQGAAELTIIYDITSPTVTITSSINTITNSNSIPLTITFSEVVTGFTVDDINVVNGTVTDFNDGGSIYTVTLVPASSGTVTVNIAGNVATDAVGNGNIIASEYSIVYDGIAPSVMISSNVGSTITNPEFNVTITFTERVSGFINSDIAIGNGSLSGLSTSDSIVFNATATATAQGTVTINIPAGVANDLAGNNNTAADEFSVIYNPSVGIDDIKHYEVNIYAVQGAIIIEINNPEQVSFTKGQVEVYNVIGLPVINKSLKNFSKSRIIMNDASGVYVVKLSLDKDTHMKKVFVNK